MNEYFRGIADHYYPSGCCALLVRDAWAMLYNLTDLPKHIDQFVTTQKADSLMNGYEGILVKQISQPEHGCMITTRQGKRWHCGIYSTEQMPHHVIHCVAGKVKIETFHQFKQRFDSVEFYKCLQ